VLLVLKAQLDLKDRLVLRDQLALPDHKVSLELKEHKERLALLFRVQLVRQFKVQ
jgi:hypothetical protein